MSPAGANARFTVQTLHLVAEADDVRARELDGKTAEFGRLASITKVDVDTRRPQVADVLVGFDQCQDWTGQSGIGLVGPTAYDVRGTESVEVVENHFAGQAADDACLMDIPVLDAGGEAR